MSALKLCWLTVTDETDDGRGEFWIAGTPDHRVSGSLTYQRGTQPKVTLDDALVAGPTLDTHQFTEYEMTVITRPRTAEEAVASFRPVTLHGQLSNEVQVTGLAAQNHGGDGDALGGMPDYRIRFLLVGGLVEDDTVYRTLRFQVAPSYWLPQVWAHPDSCDIDQPGIEGSLSAVVNDTGQWLVYTALHPLTLREMLDNIAAASLVFFGIAFDRKLTLARVEVQTQDQDDWIHVVSEHAWEQPTQLRLDALLAPESVTVPRIAAFLELHNKLDGLTEPIATPVRGPIQVTLLANAAIVEGVHRRLWPERKRFTLPLNTSLKKVRREARAAGVRSFVDQEICDEPTATKTLNDALGFIDDISFVDRVRDIVNEVGAIVPEIFESVLDFDDRLVAARNELAHQLLPDPDKNESLSDKIDRWAALNWVTPWMLRVLFLHRAGVTAMEIDHGLKGYRPFEFFQANTRQVATELGWIPPAPASAGGDNH